MPRVAQAETWLSARRIALLPAPRLQRCPALLPLDVTRERGRPLGAPLPVGCNPRAPPAAWRAQRYPEGTAAPARQPHTGTFHSALSRDVEGTRGHRALAQVAGRHQSPVQGTEQKEGPGAQLSLAPARPQLNGKIHRWIQTCLL